MQRRINDRQTLLTGQRTAMHNITVCKYPGCKIVSRHEMVVGFVVEFYRYCYGNLRDVQPNPDIAFPGSAGDLEPADVLIGGNLCVDVTVKGVDARRFDGAPKPLPLSQLPEWLSRGGRRKKTLQNLDKADVDKIRKHEEACKHHNYQFEPFVASSVGSLHPRFEKFLDAARVHKRSLATDPATKAATDRELKLYDRKLSAIFYYNLAYAILAHVPAVSWRYQSAPSGTYIRNNKRRLGGGAPVSQR